MTSNKHDSEIDSLQSFLWENQFWSNAKNMGDFRADLSNFGLNTFEICGVIHGRESEFQFMENQICNEGGIIIDASPSRISGETDSVTWACKPDGGLFPVDLHLVAAFCDDLVALDEICRAVLFKQLLVNGFSEHSIKSVLNQLDWCYDSNGELLAPTIIQEGWESVGEELSPT